MARFSDLLGLVMQDVDKAGIKPAGQIWFKAGGAQWTAGGAQWTAGGAQWTAGVDVKRT